MITIDDDLVKSSHMSEGELKQTIAVLLYERKIINMVQARRFSGLNRVGFMQLLGKYQIPMYDGIDELIHDIQRVVK